MEKQSIKYKGKWPSKLVACMWENSLQNNLNQKKKRKVKKTFLKKDFDETFQTTKVKPILFYRIEFSYLYVPSTSFSKHTVVVEI